MTDQAAGSPLIGRSEEIDRVKSILGEAPGGPRVILLSGEAGIGKTRLLREIATQSAVSGWTILQGHAYDSEGMPPYLPFLEALRDYVRDCPAETLKAQLAGMPADLALILPDLPSRFPDLLVERSSGLDGEQYGLFEGILEFAQTIARASSNGLLLCLEDLHWSDTSTLLLLEHLARRGANTRFVMMATFRDDDVESTSPFAVTLSRLARQGLAQRVELKRLNRDEVAAFLTSLASSPPPYQVVDAFYLETEGNPFYLTETFDFLSRAGRLFDAVGAWRSDLRVGDVDLPQGVRLVTEVRLRQLSNKARDVLSLASVLGHNFDFNFLQGYSALSEDVLLSAIEEAEKTHLVTVAPSGEIAFAHELIRQTLLNTLSPLRRQRLHLRAGLELEKRSPEKHAAALAEHFVKAPAEAANLAKAVLHAQVAAEQAMSVHAHREAMHCLEQTIEAQQRLAPEDKATLCDLQLALCAAVYLVGDYLRVGQIEGEVAYALALELQDDHRAAEACRLASVSLLCDAIDATNSVLYVMWTERAQRHADATEYSQVNALLGASNVLFHADRSSEAQAIRRDALEQARSLPERSALFAVAALHLHLPGPPSQDRAVLELARELAGATSEGLKLTLFGAVLGPCSLQLAGWGERALAEMLWLRIDEILAITHSPALLARRLQIKIMEATLDGRLEDAVAAGEEIMTRADEVGGAARAISMAVTTFRALKYLGQPDESLAQLHRFAEITDRPLVPAAAILWGQFGRPADAQAFLDRWLGHPRFVLSEAWTGRLVNLLEIAVIVGDKIAAQALAEPLRVVPGRIVIDTLCIASVARVLGDTDVLLGCYDDARAYYEQGIEACETARFRPEAAICRLELAALLLARYPSEASVALDHLEVSLTEARAMGMQPAIERALALKAGRPALARVSRFPDGLSPREGEVLKLIAAGRTNREISSELVLSVRTVARHITNIYAKIGTRSKAEATAYAIHRGLT